MVVIDYIQIQIYMMRVVHYIYTHIEILSQYYIYIIMSVYSIASRVGSVEYSVDELIPKTNSHEAILSGITPCGVDVTVLQSAINFKAPKDSPAFTGTVTGISKSMVGLGNVDNTSDASKPISSATLTALNSKAPKENPTFTGAVNGITRSKFWS